MKRSLTPQYVLADLFDTDFPVPIPDPQAAAEIIIQRLIDAGFEIKPAEDAGRRLILPKCHTCP